MVGLAPPSLLGPGSRHCYGINYTHVALQRLVNRGAVVTSTWVGLGHIRLPGWRELPDGSAATLPERAVIFHTLYSCAVHVSFGVKCQRHTQKHAHLHPISEILRPQPNGLRSVVFWLEIGS
jgi:hypothetical protein